MWNWIQSRVSIISFFRKKICKKISNSGIDLLKGLLNKDPMKRLSAA